jgi:hypothetical protein
VRKWIPPDDFQGHALRSTHLFFANDHRPLLVLSGLITVAEAFRLASISFIAVMSRISAKEKW